MGGAWKTISHAAPKHEAFEQRKCLAGDGCCINHARSISARSEETRCGAGGVGEGAGTVRTRAGGGEEKQTAGME